MKKFKGIIIGILLFGAIVGGIIFWQANAKVADPIHAEAEEVLGMDKLLIEMSEEDLAAYTDKYIAVRGIVWSTEGNNNERTITIAKGDLDAIICQIDNRHLENASKLKKGSLVQMKGKLTGYDFDDMLGKTIQMKNCVLTQ